MNWKKLLMYGAIGYGIYYFLKKRGSLGSLSGLGVGGRPRRGIPKTDAERRASHSSRYGNGVLPPRGSGLPGR